MPKLVFSCLFNEDFTWHRLLVDNFLAHTPDNCHLIINSGSILAEVESDRIHMFVGSKRNSKLGHYLLRGHLESLDWAMNFLDDIEFFISMASNSLFFRSLDIKELRDSYINSLPRNLCIDLNALPSEWLWLNLKDSSAFPLILENLEQKGILSVANEQIEGLAATVNDWLLIRNVFGGLLPLLLSSEINVPFEEIIPVSAIHSLGSKRHTHICKVFWPSRHPDKPQGLVSISDLIEVQILPKHICMYKWFARDQLVLETRLVTTWAGQSTLKFLQELIPVLCDSSNVSRDDVNQIYNMSFGRR